ncbi:MAG: YajQ family cyclic di-GMP-binding protein [Gammaproteobacteria bacterium]|nr:YajQ family cyclic di-GMP-binding protein [Gammaproteobacteria bacterium]
MPSFDVVSELDMHEITNAVDQANKEITTRYDFKGTNASFEGIENKITMRAPSDFQLKQMLDILCLKLSKRGIDIACIEESKPEIALHEARQLITLRHGLDAMLCKKIQKLIKDSKLKVQASIQGEKLRVTGKKRDDLQSVIALLKDTNLDLPLQYVNFRD